MENPEMRPEQVNTFLLFLPNSHVVEEVMRKDLYHKRVKKATQVWQKE